MTASSRTAADLVADAKTRVQNLTPEQVAAELERGGVLLVDVREAAERDEAGVIAGAIHAPRGMLEFLADPTSPYHHAELQPERRIILQCASGGRSALAAETLARLGYDDVGHLDGGLRAWVAEGRPVQAAR